VILAINEKLFLLNHSLKEKIPTLLLPKIIFLDWWHWTGTYMR